MKNHEDITDIGSILSRFPIRSSADDVVSDARDTGGEKQTPRNESADEESSKKSKERRMAIFEARPPRYKFSDLILPQKVFDELDVLESMLKNHSIVYDDWGMSEIDPYGRQIAFNLFGPPGTGKTMIVEALAGKWNKPLIDVNMAQLESKYVGDTGKNIEAAFASARANDAFLFFDEADAVLGRRLSEVRQSADSSVNSARSVMLKQLEQHTGIVAFATNFAHNYDNAFVRRILKHIQLELPDATGREQLFKRKIPLKTPGYNDLNWADIVAASTGFAGGDILATVKNALFDAARRKEQVLTSEMVLNAVKEWRTAKANIGQSDLVTIDHFRKEDLPEVK